LENKEKASLNLEALQQVLKEKVHLIEVNLNESEAESNYTVQGRQVADYLSTYSKLSSYTDIVVDISALPRSIYFPMINQLIKLCGKQNLHVIVAENSGLDLTIKANELEESANYMFSFSGEMQLIALNDLPVVWFPVIGEGKTAQLERIYRTIKDNTKNPKTIEICPILPFPAKNPRRVDNLIAEYHRLLLEGFEVEPRNIIYADEKNPFDIYRQIIDAAKLYDEALKPVGGCRKVVSVLSSKLLSLGALIAANEGKMAVAYVGAQSYTINDSSELVQNLESDTLHEVWLLGEPYDNEVCANNY
jgi:hypothetical protein